MDAKIPLLLAILAACLSAQPEYVSRVWRTQDGLPENRVRALAQTPDGYLWVGTSGGLARFDGVRFTVYTRFNTPAMTEDNIRGLSVAPDGALWAATDGGGLLHLRNGQFTAYGPRDGLTSDFVASVIEDATGTVWAATNRGLFRRQSGRFALASAPKAFFFLTQSPQGHLYAGGQPGLFRLDSGTPERITPAAQTEEVFRIRAAGSGALWVHTNHGLRAENAGSPDLSPLQGKAIAAFAEDHANTLWIGTLGEGIYRYPQGQRSPTRLAAPLPDATVLSILEDREHTLWIGTADGLARLTEPDVNFVDLHQGVSTVYCSPSGDVWLTAVNGRAYRYANGVVNPVQLPPPASGLRLLGVYQDPSGARWFGTDNQGAIRVANGVATRLTMREGLRNNGIQFFHAARNGLLWIGTTSGLSLWDGKSIRNFYTEDGLSYGWVRAIAEDANGDTLIGTDRGLNRFRDGKFILDASFAPLARDKVWSILPLGSTLWLGTRNGGLVRLRDGKLARLTTKEGLLGNAIFQLVAAGEDRLWISGPSGISSAAFADLNAAADGRFEPGRALAYRIGGGQESEQINGGVQPAGCVAANGELWFPGVKGAIHFKSRRPPIRRHTPVRIESVTVDGVNTTTIPPGRHRLRIEFTSPTLRAPESVTFRYKLDGYDANWISAAGPRAADYDNLPPGAYRFQVIAQDESPGANSSSAEVALTVQPHFYQTRWFLLLVLAAAAAAIAAVFVFRERRARQAYNLRLAERTRIAREMHDTLVQGCVGVSTLIEAAHADSTHRADLLDSARVHLRLTIDEARQALTDLRHDSFENGLPAAIGELAHTVAAERGIPVSLQLEGTPIPLPGPTIRALLLVTREAIRNAVLHAAPTAIDVSLLYGNAAIELDIHDNGRGFAPPQNSLAATGHFGILGMRERMEQIGGTLDVSSEPGAGATVSARLPISR